MDRIRTAISGVRGVKLGSNAAFDLTEFAGRLEVHVTAPPTARAGVTKVIREELRLALGPGVTKARAGPGRPALAPARPRR